MGLLTDAAQLIFGIKTFRHGAVFQGPVRFEDIITRTRKAAFKMDPNSPPGTDVGTLKGLSGANTIVSINPSGVGWTTLDLRGYLPFNVAKAAYLLLRVAGTTAGNYGLLAESSARASGLELQAYVVNTASPTIVIGPVLLNGGQCAYYTSSADMTELIIILLGYYA